jgi:hypothetical protein
METKAATLTIYLDNGKYCVREQPEPIKIPRDGKLEVYPPYGPPEGCVLCFDQPFLGQKCWPLSDMKVFDVTGIPEKKKFSFDIVDGCKGCPKLEPLLGAHSIQIGN